MKHLNDTLGDVDWVCGTDDIGRGVFDTACGQDSMDRVRDEESEACARASGAYPRGDTRRGDVI